MQHNLYNTPLANRTLWYDGESSFDPSKLLQLSKQFDVRYVDHPHPLVDQYNRIVTSDKFLKVKDTVEPFGCEWTIPTAFKQLNVLDYIATAHAELMADCPDDEMQKRELRLARELKLYVEHGLEDVLRAIIWIINRLTTHNVVWGVGRGSSVSSYLLYVIGVHDVDSYAYDLDIEDFLHS